MAWTWQALTILALYALVRLTLHMIGNDNARTAMLWTAVAIWFEPIRNILDFSQVGVFLTVTVLYAVHTKRAWVSGVLVGMATGVKLTPAITGIYFLATRRWKAALVTAGVFLATIGLSAAFFPAETRYYFTDLIDHFSVPLSTALNQSWRGTLGRIAGHDVEGWSQLAVLLTLALALAAWLRIRDDLGRLLVIQLFALTATPIAWTHHWVWVIPLIVWLVYQGSKLGWVWFALMLVGVPTVLSLQQTAANVFSRPWFLAWGEAVYTPMTLATFVWMIWRGSDIGAPNDTHGDVRRRGDRVTAAS